MGFCIDLYSDSDIIGGYTYSGHAYITSKITLYSNLDKLYSNGWIYLVREPTHTLNSIRNSLPVNLADSPNGWLIGRANPDWQSRLVQNMERIIKTSYTYYPLVFPEHSVGNFYIVESVPSDMIPRSVISNKEMRAGLTNTLALIKAVVKDQIVFPTDSLRELNYTYIPTPVYYPASDLLFQITYNVARKHFGKEAKFPELSIITPHGEMCIMKNAKHGAYDWEKCSSRIYKSTIIPPNGWIRIQGTPEETREYIENIYKFLGAEDYAFSPHISPDSFAAVTDRSTYIHYSNRYFINHYPLCSSFYIEPIVRY
jgi:hypothetical protein